MTFFNTLYFLNDKISIFLFCRFEPATQVYTVLPIIEGEVDMQDPHKCIEPHGFLFSCIRPIHYNNLRITMFSLSTGPYKFAMSLLRATTDWMCKAAPLACTFLET